MEFSGKTILVTGATGLIGSHIVDRFMGMGNVRVIALSRNGRKLKEGFADYISEPSFQYIEQDISRPLCLYDTPVDVIFHAASPMSGKMIANFPVDVISPNLFGTQNCLEFLRGQEAAVGLRGRLILFSSVTVYGNVLDRDIVVSETDTAISEALECSNAPYSQSKRMSEVIVQAYRKQYNLDAVIARISTVYGDTRFKPETAFFEFINRAIAGEDIVLNNSGAPRRDNIYIDDVISGLLAICQKGIDGQAYNISSNMELGNFAAIDEIAELIVRIANRCREQKFDEALKVIYKAGKNATRKPGLILENTKLKSLGWSLETNLEAGIAKTIASCPGSW